MITIYQATRVPGVKGHDWKFTYLEDSESEELGFPFKAHGITYYFVGDFNEIITIPSV